MCVEFVNILDVDGETVELVRNWRNNKKISRYMYTNHQINREEHMNWINKLKTNNTAKAWIIKYDEKPIGLATLSDIDYQSKITDWGFYIANESYRGKGLGEKSLKKLMKIVFDEMKFKTMNTKVLDNNPVAMNLYEKLGFKKTDILNETLIRDGEKVKIVSMSISK